MATAELYGTPMMAAQADGGYKPSDEYKGQGSERTVRDLTFRYHVQVQDAAGNKSLKSVTIPRGTVVTIEQIGLIALEKGERNNSFYTDKQQEALKSTGRETTPVGGEDFNFSEAGEFELAEWIEKNSPTIDEVMEAVGDDKELAQRMLQAENIATDGDPRKGVTAGLTAVIEA